MKKFLEEKHDILAGIFGVLAVIAIICEVAFGGFTKEGFVGGLKDLSGIFIDVLVLIVAASVLIRKPINFKEKFHEAMESLKKKYEPLLVEDKKEGVIRYNIASNSDALFSKPAKSPERIFELEENKPEKICFYVNKSFFNHVGGTGYDPEKIASQIALRLQAYFKDYDIKTFPNNANYGIEVNFNRTLSNDDDINDLISLIDYTILLFVARNQS